VYENTPRTIGQLKDAIRREIQAVNFDTLGKVFQKFGETHSSMLGCEKSPVSASIMSGSCFASFPVCVYKFSSHYLNNIIFIDNSLGPLATESSFILRTMNNFYFNFYYVIVLLHKLLRPLPTQSCKIDLSRSALFLTLIRAINFVTLCIQWFANTFYSGRYELLHIALSFTNEILSIGLTRNLPFWVTTVDLNKPVLEYR
jgi:hypothetical protein